MAAKASVTWDGLEELKEALMNLPEELTGEAGHILEATGNAAVHEIKAAYPSVTGNLRDHVEMAQYTAGRFGVIVVIQNTAKHAWIYEHGTEARHYYTDSGALHPTGRMPPGKVFIPLMMKHRRRMYQALADLLERHGIEATVDLGLAA